MVLRFTCKLKRYAFLCYFDATFGYHRLTLAVPLYSQSLTLPANKTKVAAKSHAHYTAKHTRWKKVEGNHF